MTTVSKLSTMLSATENGNFVEYIISVVGLIFAIFVAVDKIVVNVDVINIPDTILYAGIQSIYSKTYGYEVIFKLSIDRKAYAAIARSRSIYLAMD